MRRRPAARGQAPAPPPARGPGGPRAAAGLGLAVLFVLGCRGTPGLPLPGAGRPVWEEPPPPVRAGPVVPRERLHRGELENGLRWIALEDPRLPLLSVGIAFRRGAGAVEPARAGLATFLAELMERGAGERDALALARAVDRLGADLSVQAGWDSLTVTLSGLSRDRDRLMELLADVALRPRLDPGEVDRVRAQQLAALERSLDSPGTLAAWHLARVLYPGHRYGLPLEGTPATVAGLDGEAARQLHRRLAVGRDMVFFAVGELPPEALLGDLRERFGNVPAGEPPPPAPEPPAPAPPELRVVVVDRPDAGQAQVQVGHDGMARDDPDRIAASLVEAALGSGGFSSRLMSRIRSDAGLTYSVYAAFAMRRRPGPFLVSTATRVPAVARTVELVLEELERIRQDPPGADELRRFQSLLAGRFALSLETSEAIVSGLVDLELHDLPEDSLDTYRERVRAVAPEDAARVARERVHPERVAIVVVGPAEALEPELRRLGPVRVVEPEAAFGPTGRH